MASIIIGLGNPGAEYENTRHNVGRILVKAFAKKENFKEWKEDKKANALVTHGAIGKSLCVCALPETFMNKSGTVASKYVKSVKAAEKLIVVYDDLDLPLGKIKISFNRGSGGHKGVESVTRAIKTKKFTRIRVGVSKEKFGGKLNKPQGEKQVIDFILGKFTSDELDVLKKLEKQLHEAIRLCVQEGYLAAMNSVN